jgi:hypothetical protein
VQLVAHALPPKALKVSAEIALVAERQLRVVDHGGPLKKLTIACPKVAMGGMSDVQSLQAY